MGWTIIIVAVAALVIYFRQQAIKQQSHDRVTGMMWEITERRTNGSIEPDLDFAAIGYMRVAITRRSPSSNIDLHELEEAQAATLLRDGCSPTQALSARWGGACAISDPLYQYDDAISVYKKTAEEHGKIYNDSEEAVRHMYKSAAILVMTALHSTNPLEFQRFLQHVSACEFPEISQRNYDSQDDTKPVDTLSDEELQRRKNSLDQRLKALKR